MRFFDMHCSKRFAQILVLLLSCSTFAQSEKSMRLDDDYGDAFTNYLPYYGRPKKEAPKPQKPAPTAPETARPSKGEERVDIEWLIKNYPLIEKRAIDNPTPANVSAQLYAQRIIMDKAQRYEEARNKVVNEDPVLNENNRIPYASTGAQAIRNADYMAQQQAVRELAAVGGLVAFVDGTCRFCAQQMPILGMLKNNYGIETLVVSIDGRRPKGYTGPLVKDNGLYKKLQLKLTPSVVYVPRPKAYAGEVDPNNYLVVSQGFYAADELVKLMAYAGHSTKLLTAETMRDLDVWTRGVASNEDLQSITLDPNKPETFKEKLQPLLLKQYQ